MPPLSVGDAMPSTTLLGEQGLMQLRDRIGKPLVVYFYPADETPGCTKEACSFRDLYEDFVAAGAEVIGISHDDQGSHDKFKAHHRLPFTLLSDPKNAVAKSWGIVGFLGMPKRVTFVFDKAGIVRDKFDSLLRAGTHVDNALTIVKSLAR
jgi:peroxiredoxin Q/BCP